MAFSSSLFVSFSIIYFLFILPTFSSTITLDLSPTIPLSHSSLNLDDIISDIAKSSLQRAYVMKHGKKINHPSYTTTPLFPRSFGAYSLSLPFGTPAQNIPALFDTGSSVVWVPCTSQYKCDNCGNSSTITTYKPNKSSSQKLITCNERKCKWLDQPGQQASCPSCNSSLPGGCSMPCSYSLEYGSGDTTGSAMFENLLIQGKLFKDFFFGCSFLSDQQPEGIVGFGRSPTSVPSQLKLTKFAYCLVNHKFDDKPKSSSLILGTSHEVPGIKYTPLLKNPTMLPYNNYYYIQVNAITVGNKLITVPRNTIVPSKDGNGGTVIDSGSTLTIMIPSIFDPVIKAFVAQMSRMQQKRTALKQSAAGNLLCIDITGEHKDVKVPQVVFHFKGGATMELPVPNYFHPSKNIKCLPFVNATFQVGLGGGPAIILGNYQQQNHYLEYDLVNERLGMKFQKC